MERATVEVYERRAADYAALRPPAHGARANALAAVALPGLPVADLGCGPGGYLTDLAAAPGRGDGGAGRPVVALDAAAAMLALAGAASPSALRVRADLEALPFRRSSLGGAWSRNAYLHVPRERLPMALASLHDALAVGAPLALSVVPGEGDGPLPGDDLPGRFFSRWSAERLADVVEGAGFEDVATETAEHAVWVTARRARTLPDFVGPGMALLACGLNPSVVAADAGYGYAGRSNRFWPAVVAAGLVGRPRDPRRALAVDGVGMTCLVKRATPNSAQLAAEEYRRGAARVERLVAWLQPRAVVFVGLEGWRAAIDKKARPGWQPEPFGGRPAYVMPSTSGLNAHSRLADLVGHFRAAAAPRSGAGRG